MVSSRAVVVALLAGLSILGAFGPSVAAGESAEARESGSQEVVTMEWLGHMFFRFTSPNGVVVLTSPWLENPDSPIGLDDLGRVDFILVPDAHGDDMGQALEIAIKTGATVVAPRLLGQWLVDNGLDSAQLVGGTQVGAPVNRQGIRIRPVEGLHDNSIRDRDARLHDGSPALGYMITFENGFTVYFAASSFVSMDMQLYGMLYQPEVALLTAQHGAFELAHMARLLRADNPNLTTVIPIHIRSGAPIVQQVEEEIDRLGLPLSVFHPVIGQSYRY